MEIDPEETEAGAVLRARDILEVHAFRAIIAVALGALMGRGFPGGCSSGGAAGGAASMGRLCGTLLKLSVMKLENMRVARRNYL